MRALKDFHEIHFGLVRLCFGIFALLRFPRVFTSFLTVFCFCKSKTLSKFRYRQDDLKFCPKIASLLFLVAYYM